MDYAPIVRIILRYVVGAGIMGSEQTGNMLAADPDIVVVGCLVLGAVVEGFYVLAKVSGGKT